MTHSEVLSRYRPLNSGVARSGAGNVKAGCTALLNSIRFDAKYYQVGLTKLFLHKGEIVRPRLEIDCHAITLVLVLRADGFLALESLLHAALLQATAKLQRVARGMLGRRAASQRLKTAVKLQVCRAGPVNRDCSGVRLPTLLVIIIVLMYC